MKDRLLNEHGGLRTFAVILDAGDEALAATAAHIVYGAIIGGCYEFGVTSSTVP